MDENQILELLLARNEQAIGEVDNVYGKRLYNLAYGILKNREDAGECVNDTLWKAWRAIPPARPKYLWAFLSKICRNTAISRLRFENAEKRHGGANGK